MDAEQLTRIRSQRLAFLRSVYDATGGSRMGRVRMQEVATELALPQGDAANIAQYLVDEHLLEWAAMGGLMELTHWGIKEIEESISAPDEATQHFPPMVIAQNYLQVGSMVGSSVQQGSEGLVQSSGLDTVGLEALAGEIRRLLETHTGLDEADTNEAAADLATLESQLASPRAKLSIVRESLASLRRILEGAVATGAGAAAGPQLPELVERIGHALAQI
jgi:hypothetical protein